MKNENCSFDFCSFINFTSSGSELKRKGKEISNQSSEWKVRSFVWILLHRCRRSRLYSELWLRTKERQSNMREFSFFQGKAPGLVFSSLCWKTEGFSFQFLVGTIRQSSCDTKRFNFVSWKCFAIFQSLPLLLIKFSVHKRRFYRCFSFCLTHYTCEWIIHECRNVTNNITLLIVMQQWIIILFKHSLW